MRLGLGLGLTSVAIAGGYVWSPSKLNPLFWAGSLDPASGRMWQTSAGATPVTAAGQPVGRMLSSAGAIAALQPTALSRPTLARWPKGGRRNLLPFSDRIAVGSGFTDSGLVLPIDPRKLVANVAYSQHRINFNFAGTAGDVWSADLKASGYRYAGHRFDVSGGVLYDLELGTISFPGPVDEAGITPLGDGWFRVWHKAQADYSIMYLNTCQTALIVTAFVGDTVSGTEVARQQLERGGLTAYQKVTTANDITEAGVPDVWHLFDDGGDSLPAVFPAGNLHLSYVNQLGAVSYSTATSDGTTGVDLLLAERMADVIVLDRAFTTDEEAKIEAYWARYAA